MNHTERRKVETLACERRYKIADDKGAEYSGKGSSYKETGADTLANFKNVAERIGGTPEQVLMTYLLKHIDSINTAVREAAVCEVKEETRTYDPNNPYPEEVYEAGEGIVSRLDDARNYLDLLECLLIDRGMIPEPWELYAGPVPESPDDTVSLTPEGEQLIGLIKGTELPKSPAGAAHQATLGDMLEQQGLVKGFDGTWRPPAVKDESVKNPGEVQTPIYARPAVFDPPKDPETGEL